MKNIITYILMPIVFTIFIFSTGAQSAEFRYATNQDIMGLDPHINNHTGTIGMKSNLYDPLIRRTPDGGLEPGLAVSWTDMSPTVRRFILRPNVKFQNGEAFTADDVLFSIKRAGQPNSDVGFIVATVKEARRIDDLTVDIEMLGPDPVFLQNLTGLFIMSKDWTIRNGAETVIRGAQVVTYANLNANGTGPFRLVERIADARTVLEPNPTWWDKPTHNITRATFTPIASPETRVAALLSGDLDLMYHIPLQDVPRVEQATRVKVVSKASQRVMFLGFDHFRSEMLDMPGTGKNPLKDVRVRRALYQAIDIETIRQKLMRNTSTPSALMIAPSVIGYPKDLATRLPFDAEASRKLLAEAGYGTGFPLTLSCSNNRYINDADICTAIIPMLKRIGINARLNTQPMTQYVNTAGPSGGYRVSMYMLGWTPFSGDAANPLIELMTFDGHKNRGTENWGRYTNPEVEKLTDAILVESDTKKRNQFIHDALKIVQDEVAYIPLHIEPQIFGVRDTVKSFKAHLSEVLELRQIVMK